MVVPEPPTEVCVKSAFAVAITPVPVRSAAVIVWDPPAMLKDAVTGPIMLGENVIETLHVDPLAIVPAQLFV